MIGRRLYAASTNQASGQHLGWDSPAVEFSLRQRKNFLRLAVGRQIKIRAQETQSIPDSDNSVACVCIANIASAAGNAKSKAGMFID